MIVEQNMWSFGYGVNCSNLCMVFLTGAILGPCLNSGMYHWKVEYWGFCACKLVVGKCENFGKLSF